MFDKVLISALKNSGVSILEEYKENGWDINKKILCYEAAYTPDLPLSFAIESKATGAIRWLVEQDANLNDKDSPAIVGAVQHLDEADIRYLVQHGAKVHLQDRVKKNAYGAAVYSKQFEKLTLVQSLGLSVEKYGGEAFRKVVGNFNKKAIDFFIENKVDINYNKPDMVYPWGPTPLEVAIRYIGSLDLVKYLIEQGADFMKPNKEGARPYIVAVIEQKEEIAAYLKALEPQEYHDQENKRYELRNANMSEEMIAFLQSDQLKIEFPENDLCISYIEFLPAMNTFWYQIRRSKFIQISKVIDNYSSILILWHPSKKKLYFYDVEHAELYEIGSFKQFIVEPYKTIDNYFNS
ncbi:ankyrin repeat domain-containing protein [Brevibacillus daliensis]|uniref:ankyrin repeat domain-containing protein n=1 Tax=Brevibacillus daliensis TaxID=2892995 RepID=UPI001E47538D|nr:ankyrin repeat domain-containing protein [Brevibacillus daliensis]